MRRMHVGITAATVQRFANICRPQDVLGTLVSFLILNIAFAALEVFTGESLKTVIIETLRFNAIYLLTALIQKIIYNLYFRHRGIPTTFWLSATDWTFWKIYQNGHAYKFLSNLHEELGDIVRIQPNHISFRCIEAVPDIHGSKTGVRKGDFYSYVLRQPPTPPNLLSETTKERHAALKRTIEQSFGSRALREFEPTIRRYISKYLDKLSELSKDVIDIAVWNDRLLFNTISHLSYARSFGGLDGGPEHFFIAALHKYIRLLRIFLPIPWLAKILRQLPPPKAVRESQMRTREFAQSSIRQRMETMESEKLGDRTMLGTLIETVDPLTGQKLSEIDLSTNANLIVIGGSDTTATALQYTVYFLLKERKHWIRLCNEIRSHFSSIDEITYLSATNLPFLKAVIYEGLRMRPPAPSNFPREVPPEGVVICGRYFPAGTIVSTPTWAILNDKRYFSNPDKFIPTRWIPGENEDETCNPAAWIPFGFGPRICIGKRLALMQLTLTIAMFVWTFDAELAQDTEPEYNESFVVMRSPLKIRLQGREAQRV